MSSTGVKSRGELGSFGFILLLLPFFLAGLAAVVIGVRMALRESLLGRAVMAAFGLFFVSLPSFLVALLIHARREERRRQERRAANPGRPWTWRNDFATGVLRPESEPGTAFGVAFSAFWSGGAVLAAWAGIKEYRQTGDWQFLIVLLFPAVAAGLLYWAATRTHRWLRYRGSVLRLDRTPVEIGGRLNGMILLPSRISPTAGFELTLTSLRRTRDSDNDTDDFVLWQERACVADPLSDPEAGMAIPVSIPITRECEPWDDVMPDRQVIWRLRVTADVPGARLDQVFEVPVFRTRPEDLAHPRESLPDGFIRASPRAPAPAAPRVRIGFTPEGDEFVFPPPGGPKSIAGFFIALATTAGIIWAISKTGAPLVFPVVISLLGLVPALVFLWSAAGVVRVLIGPRGVTLAYRLLGFERTWIAGPGDILEAGISVMAEAQRAPFYGILLRRRSGNPLWIFAALSDKGEAEWIASELNRRLQSATGALRH